MKLYGATATIECPPASVKLPIVHGLGELYKRVYLAGKKLNKADKLGVWSRVENTNLACLELATLAALSPANGKTEILRQLSLKIEIAKRLIRICYEIKLVADQTYLSLVEKLEEVSKMAAGWRKYTLNNEKAGG